MHKKLCWMSFRWLSFHYTMCRYVTALNNLGDAYEKAKQVNEALAAYDEALNYSPNNKVASSRAEALRARV